MPLQLGDGSSKVGARSLVFHAQTFLTGQVQSSGFLISLGLSK